ncbi:hypothetical protein JCM15548_1883 [Geofilum rubicundum JCM 15548]|uniref:Uncharacterized protein n=1 Tax=Geofilum rubicundum JCM 15548 TaxID=1236989 RepID=A0A0E9LTY3_9BACT|nr:hypothetical protein JCM15548_1883 [Geofilum rubicundum JCM 15548]
MNFYQNFSKNLKFNTPYHLWKCSQNNKNILASLHFGKMERILQIIHYLCKKNR